MKLPQKKSTVTATAAQKVMQTAEYKKFAEDCPDSVLPMNQPELAFGLDTDKNVLEKSDVRKHIHSVNDKHAWAIFLDDKLITKRQTQSGTENYLIGFENGLKARKNETHFSQKENDPVSHRILFQPEPHYISYSFFYGFFAQTIRLLCLKTVYGNDYLKYKDTSLGKIEIGIASKKEILKKFNEKYTFAFTKNPALTEMMNDYAETLIENVIEVRENLGNKTMARERRTRR